MKRMIALLILVLLAATVGACRDSKATGISGSYYFWPPDDDDERDVVFVRVEQNGTKVTVFPSCTNGAVVATGTIDGETVTLSWILSQGESGQSVGFAGTVSGRDIALTSEEGKTARLERTLEHECGSREGVVVLRSAVETARAPVLKAGNATTTETCSDKIKNALWHSQATTTHTLTSGATTTVIDDKGRGLHCSDFSASKSENKKVLDATTLSTSQFLYPGAIIQGKDYLNGNITPLTIERAGGTITFDDGLTFAKDCKKSAHVDTVTYATVSEAIKKLLECGVVGTAASFNLMQTELFSKEQWGFDLNLDVKQDSLNVMGSFNIDGDDMMNQELLSFRQQYYKVSFTPDPGTDYTEFFKHTAACAASDSIADGNPPLYVSDMTYGRIVMVVATSEHSSRELRAALSGAYNGLASNVTASTSLTYKQIMDESDVQYMAYGGSAENAVKPISATTTTGKFDAVRQTISDEKAAGYHPDNPGLPVAYSLNFVEDRRPVIRNLSTAYTGKECSLVQAEQEFTMHAEAVDDVLSFYVYDQLGSPGEAVLTINYNETNEYTYKPPANTYCEGDSCWKYLEFVLKNGWPGDTGATMRLFNGGIKSWEKGYHHGWCAGWTVTYDARFKVNIMTGEVRRDHASGYCNWWDSTPEGNW